MARPSHQSAEQEGTYRQAAADPAGGYVTEALISAIAQGDDEAKARLKAFLEKRAPKTVRN